jgi:hypothetical protein
MARASNLSAAQRTAIREVELDPNVKLNRRTANWLHGNGYITGTEDGEGWELTRHGQREFALIMESGDGPEDLKEMFRW